MRLGEFTDNTGVAIDEVTAVYMPKGKSYTGLDQVEIFCHGGRKVVELIQQTLLETGARMAEPGEFTKLAFLNGRIDLTRAESVAEIIAANTESSYLAAREHMAGALSEHIGMLRESLIDIIAEVEASIDYPEDEIDPAEKNKLLQQTDDLITDLKSMADSYHGGRIINEGYKIAIAGRPNAGKSSLFNLLLSQERALVTSTPGTTRDYLSEWLDLDGFKVNIIDTAGLRTKGSKIEKAGQVSAKKIIESADLLLWMYDLSDKNMNSKIKEDISEFKKDTILPVGNKIDIANSKQLENEHDFSNQHILISCKSKKGLKQLKEKIVMQIKEKMPDHTSGFMVTSNRHKQKIQKALRALKAARLKLKKNESPELTAFDLRLAINELDEITGKVYNEDILGRIFSKFCIGK